AVGCRDDGLVEGVSLQRQLGPRLSQTELPQPLMPAGGIRCGSSSLLQQSLGSAGLVAAGERQQRVDSGADDGRDKTDAAGQLARFRLKRLCAFEVKHDQVEPGRHRCRTSEHRNSAILSVEGPGYDGCGWRL